MTDKNIKELTPEKKWFILCNESAITGMGTVIGKKNPNTRTPVSSHHTTNNSSGDDAIIENNHSENILTPSYYIKSLLKRDTKLELRSKLVSDLSVRLRTMPIR